MGLNFDNCSFLMVMLIVFYSGNGAGDGESDTNPDPDTDAGDNCDNVDGIFFLQFDCDFLVNILLI